MEVPRMSHHEKGMKGGKKATAGSKSGSKKK